MGESKKLNFSEPEPLSPGHDLADFDCGRASLNFWLQKWALKNESKTSRTYVVRHAGKVVGFYTLAAGSVARADAPKPLQRNTPESIPVIILGRLAVDVRVQGQGLGESLLRDAILRAKNVSQEVGAKAILVHALDKPAADFYMKYGFELSPIDEASLFLPMKAINDLFE